MILNSYSGPLKRALENNSQALAFLNVQRSTVDPSTIADPTGRDAAGAGVFDAASGSEGQQQIVVYPYAEGEPGGEFWMRIYCWRQFGLNQYTGIWEPSLLCELSCVIGNLPGFSGRVISERERSCSGLAVTAGYGSAVSPGGTAAYVLIPLLGCQKFQFDFMIGEELPAFPNALWAFA